MAIEIVVEGSLEKEEQRAQFSALLQQISIDLKVKMEDYDSNVMIEVCPEGYIECTYANRYVSLIAQTNVAGPGFHAFVCSFMDALLELSFIELTLKDETLYFEQRNFEDLKYRCFYPWLQNVLDQVEICIGNEHDVCISWPLEYYVPKEKAHCIVTAMGYLSLNDIHSKEIEELARQFFIWNDDHRNASYFGNCAISLLWKECYFTYSNMNEDTLKTANTILDYIEAAYDQDAQHPLPMEAYHLLCDAIDRKPLLQDAVAMEQPIKGYRTQPVLYPFQGWRIPVDGCSEKSYDASTQTLHFMAPYRQADDPWRWLLRVNAYHSEQEDVTFSDVFQDESAFHHHMHHMEMKGIVQKQEDYQQLIMQVIDHQDTLFMECIIRDDSDAAMIQEWLLQVQHMKRTNDKKQWH